MEVEAATEPTTAPTVSGDRATPDAIPPKDESVAVTAESKNEPSPGVEDKVAVKEDKDGANEEEKIVDEENVNAEGINTDGSEIVEASSKTKKEKPSPPTPVRTSSRGRVRKSVDAYDPTAVTEKKEFIIPNGSGEKLEDMPRVVANFKNITWSDPHLKMLHQIIFGRGQKKEFKTHLLQFNGVVFPEGEEEEEREKLKQKMYKLVMSDLKEVMDLCDINRSAESFGSKGMPDKEMLCNRFLEWLEKPKASGKKVKAQAKKVAAKKSPGGKTDSAKKRGRPKGSTNSSAKKAKGTAKAEIVEENGDGINLNIPGTTIEKVREKVKSIVEHANREELTVKGVRKMLEEWLDTDLSKHKDAVRSLVMEAMWVIQKGLRY